jgi:hypothetical protein
MEWVPDLKREPFAAGVRQAEGEDCNVAGDVLLFSPGGRPTGGGHHQA